MFEYVLEIFNSKVPFCLSVPPFVLGVVLGFIFGARWPK